MISFGKTTAATLAILTVGTVCKNLFEFSALDIDGETVDF
jgi:hypothetical protein